MVIFIEKYGDDATGYEMDLSAKKKRWAPPMVIGPDYGTFTFTFT